MQAVGHRFGIEGIELGVVVEIERLNALTAAYLDKCEVEVEVLKTVRALIGVFLFSHRIRNDELRLGEITLYQADKRAECAAIGIGIC